MAEELARDPGRDPLALLGEVAPPDPAVLEHAREELWSAVAEEMLDLERPVLGLREDKHGESPRSAEAE
jgi:hypothetical protein